MLRRYPGDKRGDTVEHERSPSPASLRFCEVYPHVYIGEEAVAHDSGLLRQKGIATILHCCYASSSEEDDYPSSHTEDELLQEEEREEERDGIVHKTWKIGKRKAHIRFHSLEHFLQKIDALISHFWSPTFHAFPKSSSSSLSLLITCPSGTDLCAAMIVAHMVVQGDKHQQPISVQQALWHLKGKAPFIDVTDMTMSSILHWRASPVMGIPSASQDEDDLFPSPSFPASSSSSDAAQVRQAKMKNLAILVLSFLLLFSFLHSTADVSFRLAEVEKDIAEAHEVEINYLPAITKVPSSYPSSPTLASYTSTVPTPASHEKVKGIFISFLGHNKAKELGMIYPSIEKYMLIPHGIDWIIFYELFPRNATSTFVDWTKAQDWTPQRDEDGHVSSYLTPSGTRILTEPLALNLPIYASEHGKWLNREDWYTCAGGRNFGFPYSFYNAAITNLIARSPRLDGYDYMAKIDTDIRFLSEAPFNPFVNMSTRGCVLGHTRLYTHAGDDCGRGTYKSMKKFATMHNLIPRSEQYDWCTNDHTNFFGNFLMFKTDWIRSPENLELFRHFYEDEETSGYLRNRWGDQPIWTSSLCLWHHIDNLRNHSLVCDFEEWRGNFPGKVFTHKDGVDE